MDRLKTHADSTILLVDDSESVRGRLADYLVRAGYRAPRQAESASRALELLRAEPIDLILMDLMMPERDGISLTRELAETEGLNEIPVIMVTSRDAETDLDRALEAGAVDYIVKPVGEVELLARVRTALRLKREIDGRRERERELRENRQKLETILASVPTGIVIVDAGSGLVSEVNQIGIRIIGLRREQIVGRPCSEILGGSGCRPCEDPAGGLVTESIEGIVVAADGNHVPVLRTAVDIELSGKPYTLVSFVDISDRKRMEEDLLRLATTDDLTQTHNRRHFLDLAKSEVRRSGRYGHPVSLLMMDADHFKAINDRYGHDWGDRVLVSLAETCRRSLRTVDALGRIGGEEFAVLLPETGLEEAAELAERLRRTIASTTVREEGTEVNVTVSIGVAALAPGQSLDHLMAAADRAMYRAKVNGRNLVEREAPPSDP